MGVEQRHVTRPEPSCAVILKTAPWEGYNEGHTCAAVPSPFPTCSLGCQVDLLSFWSWSFGRGTVEQLAFHFSSPFPNQLSGFMSKLSSNA